MNGRIAVSSNALTGATGSGASGKGLWWHNRSLVLGVGILLLFVVVGIWESVMPYHDPYATGGTPFAATSVDHPLGTDNIGRDTFTRVLLAGRSGVIISALSTLFATVLGAGMGIVAGYRGGLLDSVLMRNIDGALALPGILIALLIRVILGAGVWQLVFAMSIIFAPSMARVARGCTLLIRRQEYVQAAQLSRLGSTAIIVRHVVPNIAPSLLVQSASIASTCVALEAALSYLGQGIQPPIPSAGKMIFDYQVYMQTTPILVLAPSLVVLALAVAWNLIADGIQEAMSMGNGGVR